MAKVTGTLLSMSARGQIAKSLVIKRVRGQATVAQRYAYPGSVHTITVSPAQAAQRAHYGALVQGWRDLSLSDQAAWNVAAKRLHMSGWNLYVRSTHAPHDPYWANVESLLHFDSASGSSAIVDAAGAVWTNPTPALLSSVQSVFGGTSLQTTGSAGIGNTVATTSTWMANDWTWEGRVYSTDAASHAAVWFAGTAAIDYVGIMQYTGVWWVDQAATGSTGIPVQSNQWLTLGLQNKANTLEFYIDGVLRFSVSTLGISNAATIQSLGNFYDISIFDGPFTGYIDETRLTIGVARLTDGYTVAASEFPSQ